jgi:L-serine dehydratase
VRVGVFDVYKIGVGPSSSHTTGPMRAARAFVEALAASPARGSVARIDVTLFGSLALTGKGHGTDRAILLGLMGERPETVDPAAIPGAIAAAIRDGLALSGGARLAPGAVTLAYDGQRADLVHPNTMRFLAAARDGAVLADETWLSPGGGFVRRLGDTRDEGPEEVPVPYPFASAADLLVHAAREGLGIAEIVRRNERARAPDMDVDSRLDAIAAAMLDCVARGLRGAGALPGGLGVERRAAAVHGASRFRGPRNVGPAGDSLESVGAYAMAVNEENAAGGRVVTAPTNGASGVVPAVLRHLVDRVGHDVPTIREFLLTGAAIAMLAKTNASISGAEVGCQGEVGVASAMAAAGYAAALGGSPAQAENAAEIALEHHLGLTCDPVGGLVQIPCIERNAMGAVKALAAAALALAGDGRHVVSLDAAIETMRQTGADMSSKYKETALGGLALNVTAC